MNGIELRKSLDDKGIKYSWLAEQLKVSEATITKWMNEDMPISDIRVAEIKTIIKIRTMQPV